MPAPHATQIVVVSRPNGPLKGSEVFQKETVPLAAQLKAGKALVKTVYISVDAGFRVFLDADTPYHISLGEVMRASGVGVVAEVAKGSKFSVGDFVYYRPGWRDWGVFDEETLKLLHIPPGLELIDFVATLGSSGLSAYVGLTVIGKVQAGETLLVSSAAGAVGHLACQMGKILGAKVIALAGSPEKCDVLEREFGVHKALNYKSPTFHEELAALEPFDVFFDNVGGEILNVAMTRMKQFGRIVMCGTVSRINGKEPPGLTNYMNLIVQSVRMEGFFLPHYAAHFPHALEQMSEWLISGKLQRKNVVLDGLDAAPEALASMFTNGPIGKTVVRVSHV